MSDSAQLEGDDSLPHRSISPDPLTEPEDRDDAGLYLAHLASTLAAHGGGSLSADLALDLVLNEIVEQARLASTATAASIALVSGEDLVCRATTGANAPGLGVRLPMHSGLTGACVESREPQRCDDTEIDPRVDAEAYRNLEIRSILMVPVVNGEQLLGIFQIFSPRANEFGDREAQTLKALTRRIVNSVQYAGESKAPALEETPQVAVEPETLVETQSPLPAFAKILATADRATDYWTSALTGLVIALALLLGWMAGRDGEKTQPFTPSAALPIPMPSKSSQPPKTEVAKSKERSAPASKPEIAGQSPEGISNAGLIVYDKGKIIYQASPARVEGSKESSRETIETLPPDTVASLLKNRVEPEYPETAKNARVQGDVSLRVIVNPEGLVRDVQVEDGNAQLAPAAVEAVRQWRFTPYQANGESHEFQARLVVHFRLP